MLAGSPNDFLPKVIGPLISGPMVELPGIELGAQIVPTYGNTEFQYAEARETTWRDEGLSAARTLFRTVWPC
jgi:hypothetical protein